MYYLLHLLQVYAGLDDKQISDLFVEINKAEPVLSIDLPLPELGVCVTELGVCVTELGVCVLDVCVCDFVRETARDRDREMESERERERERWCVCAGGCVRVCRRMREKESGWPRLARVRAPFHLEAIRHG